MKTKDKEAVKELSFAKQEIGCDPDLKGFQIAVRSPRAPTNKSGIILPDEYKDKMTKASLGLVVGIGPLAFTGEQEQHYKVEVGDWVWYSYFDKVQITGANCLSYFMNDTRILARIKEEDLEAVLDGAS